MASHSLTAAAREKAANAGHAMAGGRFPIRDKTELAKAIHAYGRADNKSKPAVKAHIRKRARALNATHLLPDTWK